MCVFLSFVFHIFSNIGSWSPWIAMEPTMGHGTSAYGCAPLTVRQERRWAQKLFDCSHGAVRPMAPNMGPLGGTKKSKNTQNSNNFDDFRFWCYFLRLKLLLSAGTILGLEFMKRARDSSNYFEQSWSEVNFIAILRF